MEFEFGLGVVAILILVIIECILIFMAMRSFEKLRSLKKRCDRCSSELQDVHEEAIGRCSDCDLLKCR